MKNLKRAVSLILAITIVLAMSVSAFAFSLNSGYYTYELRFENSAGEKITSAAEGSEVYLAFYLYETANPTAGANVTVNNNGMFLYDVIIPKGFMSDETSYAGSEGTEYDSSNGTTIIIDAEEFFVLLNDLGTGITVTPSSTTPIAKHKFVLGDANATPYEFVFAGNSLVFADGSTGEAKDAVQVPVSLTITAAGPQGPTVTKGTPTANNVTEYTFANSTAMEGKKILLTETSAAGSAITADTRLKVTKNGQERIFGSDIWDKLKAQGGGSINVESTIKFGLIVGKDEVASNYKFEIVGLK